MDQRWSELKESGKIPIPPDDDDLPSLESLESPAPIRASDTPVPTEPGQPSHPPPAVAVDAEPFKLPVAMLALCAVGLVACGTLVGMGLMWWLNLSPREPLPQPGPIAEVAPTHAPAIQPQPSIPIADAGKIAPPATDTGTAVVSAAPAPKLAPIPEPATADKIQSPVANLAATSAAANEPVPAEEPALEPVPAEEPFDLAAILSATGAPPPQPACRSKQEREAYIAHVKEMLEAGLGPTRDRAREQSSFEQARALCAADPRLYYGYALIHYNTEVDAALTQVQAAGREGAHPYPPVWRLHVLLLNRKEKGLNPDTIRGLVTLGRRLESLSADWPDEAGKLEFAAFLGQTVGYLRGPSPDSTRFSQVVAQTDEQLLAVLQGNRLQAYQIAQAAVAALAEELSDSAQHQAEERHLAAEKKKNAERQKGEAAEQALADNTQRLVRTKEQYDKEWEEEKVKFEKDWIAMRSEWERLAATDKQIQAKIGGVNMRIFSLERQINEAGKNMQLAMNNAKQLLNAQLMMATLEKGNLQAQQWNVQQQGAGVNFKAHTRLRELVVLERKYQARTQQAVEESDLIKEKRKQLEAHNKAVARKVVRKPAPEAVRPDLKMLTTYAPLDFEAEKRRILDSYQ